MVTPSGIALFDMDGTLLPWDCQLLFRHHVIAAEPWRAFSVPLFLVFTPFSSFLGTECMKRVFHSFLWNMSPDRCAALSEEFAEKLLPSIYPELKEAIVWHRERGHLTILSSASPECYVKEVGKKLGFDLSLGTVLENAHCFPDLINHKGPNKVSRLRKLLPQSFFRDSSILWYGYTDSRADLPMLALCQNITVVNPKAELTQLAEENQWTIWRPARPWKNRLDKALRVLALVFAVGRNPAKL